MPTQSAAGRRPPTQPPVVLFTPLGFNLAEVTRMIEVGRAVRAHGITPIFQVHDRGFHDLVEAAGFMQIKGARPLHEEEARQAIAFDQGRSFRHPFTEALVRERVAAERAAIRDCGAKAVVHGTNPTSPISARAETVPLFYPVPFVFSASHLASGQRIPYMRDSGIGRLANSLLQFPVSRALRAPALVPRAFRTVAKQNGVSLRGPLDLLGADVTLITSMPDEMGDRELPQKSYRVGPIFAKLDSPIPEIVHQLASSPHPLVYCAFGSSGTPKVTRAALQALGRAPVNVIAPVRQYLGSDDMRALPENIHVTDLLPAHELGGLIDAAVIHGGQGTVQTACTTGVPFIGIGFSAEQRWNVDVWARRGNAISLCEGDLRGRALRFHRALRALLTDNKIRGIAADVAREHILEDGAKESARLIAEHVFA